VIYCTTTEYLFSCRELYKIQQLDLVMLSSYITQFCRVGSTLASHSGGWINLPWITQLRVFLVSPFHPEQMLMQ